MYTCRFSDPRMEEEDWLLEEDVLLLEMVECGLLKGVEWSNEETAIDARDLDSIEKEKKGKKEPLISWQGQGE